MLNIPYTIEKLLEIAEGLGHPKFDCTEEADFLRGVADVLEELLPDEELTLENLHNAAARSLQKGCSDSPGQPFVKQDHACFLCRAVTITEDSLCSSCRHLIAITNQ